MNGELEVSPAIVTMVRASIPNESQNQMCCSMTKNIFFCNFLSVVGFLSRGSLSGGSLSGCSFIILFNIHFRVQGHLKVEIK